MNAAGTSLLVNFWYAHPVGHAIEALRYCLGYHRADPALSISLLLNGATPTELADLCPFIERTYPVSFTGFHDRVTDPAPALRDVPRVWDYVVNDHRSRLPDQLASYAGLRRFYGGLKPPSPGAPRPWDRGGRAAGVRATPAPPPRPSRGGEAPCTRRASARARPNRPDARGFDRHRLRVPVRELLGVDPA
jgi:hypothetical protein